jgi:hypothetical protein
MSRLIVFATYCKHLQHIFGRGSEAVKAAPCLTSSRAVVARIIVCRPRRFMTIAANIRFTSLTHDSFP